MVMQRKQKQPDDGTVTAVPVATAPSPEMSDRPRRRTFTAALLGIPLATPDGGDKP